MPSSKTNVRKIKTARLKLAYEESGPKTGEPLLLLHGWPDSPRTWDKLLPDFHEAGYRTIAPYLRGYGLSTFRTRLLGSKPARTGQPVAFAQDIIDLADRLQLKRFHYIGHDWGARTGYVLAALHPHRLKSFTSISVPFQPGKSVVPSFPQDRAYWYQWLLCTHGGAKKFREDPVAFGREQWDTWSPQGWYTEEEFADAAKSWTGTDFVDVVLHSYRSRWGHAPLDPRYAKVQARFESVYALTTPTLLLHGAADACVLQATTDGAERYFKAYYRRALLDGVGHFPQRENPKGSFFAIYEHLQRHS